MDRRHVGWLAAAAGSTLLFTALTPSPAYAEEASTPSAEESVESIRSIAPEVLVDLAAPTTMSSETVAAADTDGNETTTLEASTSTAAIADPSGTALALTLVDESGHPSPSEITADQHMSTQHADGVSSTTLLHDDGSVQTVSVISEPASATRTQHAVEAEGLAAIS